MSYLPCLASVPDARRPVLQRQKDLEILPLGERRSDGHFFVACGQPRFCRVPTFRSIPIS